MAKATLYGDDSISRIEAAFKKKHTPKLAWSAKRIVHRFAGAIKEYRALGFSDEEIIAVMREGEPSLKLTPNTLREYLKDAPREGEAAA